MVSLQASQASEERKACLMDNLVSRKRKREEGKDVGGESTKFSKDMKFSRAEEAMPASLELHLNMPLPLDWQRCLDVKSGKIHYYNSRTQKRTSRDPRASPEPPSLNLELNLRYEPQTGDVDGGEKAKQRRDSAGMSRSVSWVSLDADEQHEEMMAAVCMRCYMLVMMCMANPSCPNCKFVNSQDRSNSGLFKPGSGFYVGRIDVEHSKAAVRSQPAV